MVTVNHFIFVSMAINIRTNNVRRHYFSTKTPDDAIGLTKARFRLFSENLENIGQFFGNSKIFKILDKSLSPGKVDCPSFEIPEFPTELPEIELHEENHSHEISDEVIQEIAHEVAADLSDTIASEVAGMIDIIASDLAEQLNNHEHTHHASSDMTSSDVTSLDMTPSEESSSFGELYYFQLRI